MIELLLCWESLTARELHNSHRLVGDDLDWESPDLYPHNISVHVWDATEHVKRTYCEPYIEDTNSDSHRQVRERSVEKITGCVSTKV